MNAQPKKDVTLWTTTARSIRILVPLWLWRPAGLLLRASGNLRDISIHRHTMCIFPHVSHLELFHNISLCAHPIFNKKKKKTRSHFVALFHFNNYFLGFFNFLIFALQTLVCKLHNSIFFCCTLIHWNPRKLIFKQQKKSVLKFFKRREGSYTSSNTLQASRAKETQERDTVVVVDSIV